MLFFETSAKTGSNVEKAFFTLTEEMAQRDFLEAESNTDNSYFDQSYNPGNDESCCGS